MPHQLKNFILVILIGSLAVSCGGCVWLAVGAVAGAGTYAWMHGVLQKDFMVSAQELQAATRRAFNDLDMTITEQTEDRLSAVYKAALADGENVSLTIEALTERSARIRIRVGMFGDEVKSEMILSALEQRL